MNAETTARVYQTWAEHFQLPPECFFTPGTTVYVNEKRSAQGSIDLWHLGEQVVVETPSAREGDVRQLAAQFPEDYRLTADDFRRAWGEVPCFGMPLYALEPALFRSYEVSAPYTLRQLTPNDQPAFDAFLEQCSEDDRDEGDVSIDHMIAFGVFAGERITATSSVFIWRRFIDMGVLTDPVYRGRGFGKALVSACAAHYLHGEHVIGYRHAAENVGSEKIALSLGFTHYGFSDSIELQPT